MFPTLLLSTNLRNVNNRSNTSSRKIFEIGNLSTIFSFIINLNFSDQFLVQAQVTPDNHMFDFPIGEIDGDEASSAAPSSASMPDEIKERLQEILPLLDQDISLLVQNIAPIRTILLKIMNQVPGEILEAQTPMAFIENLQVQVIKAKKKLADHIHYTQLLKDSKTCEAEAKALHQRPTILKLSCPSIIAKIDRLKARQAELRKELRATSEAI